MNDRGRPKLVRRIDGTQLIANLAEVLEEIISRGAVYLVHMAEDRGAGDATPDPANPARPIGFAFGPPQVLGRVFALIDEMEYGWPRDVQVSEVTGLPDLIPRWHRHPLLWRDGTPVAMSINAAEYQQLQEHWDSS